MVEFTGGGRTIDDDNQLVQGAQGEVVGPATGDAVRGNGVAVKFPGNKGNADCRLEEVCAHPPVACGCWRVGSALN